MLLLHAASPDECPKSSWLAGWLAACLLAFASKLLRSYYMLHLSVQGSAELVQATGQGSLLFSTLPWHPSLDSLQLLYQVTNCLLVLYTHAPAGRRERQSPS
jgi:hypothetical protein